MGRSGATRAERMRKTFNPSLENSTRLSRRPSTSYLALKFRNVLSSQTRWFLCLDLARVEFSEQRARGPRILVDEGWGGERR
jgi:hypothetical protein